MKTKLVQIGNSRGIRIPKTMIKDAKLLDEVEISVKEDSIIITSIEKCRTGWAEFAKELHERKEDILLFNETTTKFEENDWNW